MSVKIGTKSYNKIFKGETEIGKMYVGETMFYQNTPSETFIEATGGSVTEDGIYKVHAFTDVGQDEFEVTQLGSEDNNKLEILIIAGGGGAGGIIGGGGGAGGYIHNTGFTPTMKTYNLTIGNGGTGGAGYNLANQQGTAGQDSVFDTLTAIGGGGGAGWTSGDASTQGGSGGGGTRGDVNPPSNGTAGQGNAGGVGNSNRGGGGGGATEAGEDGGVTTLGGGGDGYDASEIFGTTYGEDGWFAGGGAGGVRSGHGSGNVGGKGGGGDSTTTTIKGEDAQANTGGGGGAAGYNGSSNNQMGGNGGSGIILIRYRIPIIHEAPTNLTYSNLGGSGADLSWTNNSNIGMNVIQMQSGATWVDVEEIDVNESNYTITDLSGDTEYTFRVVRRYN